MAQNTTITVPADTWTQLTDANVTAITFRNNSSGGYELLVKGTAGAVAPTDSLGSIGYPAGFGERNVLLADLFPGVSGRNRLYVYARTGASVFVSHA